MGQSSSPGVEQRPEELKALLLKACPPDKHGHTNIKILSPKIGVSYQRIYKWIAAGRIPPDRAARAVAVSEGRVSLNEFLPFFFSA